MELSVKDKIIVIEKHFGSGAAAAEAAGVTHTSWSRWKNGSVKPIGLSLTAIELLYEKAAANGAGARAGA